MPKVYIKTYGCQMNTRDSEQVARQFQQKGYDLVSDETLADVILINTCSVRDQAEQKAISNMGRLKELKQSRSNLVLGFMGCMAQSRGKELLDRLPDADLVVGTQRFHQVTDYVEEIQNTNAQSPQKRHRIVNIEEERQSEDTIRDHLITPKQSSSFISIMQGCNMKCSFCIVPSTRGKERSRPIESIVQEIKHLVASGIKEVTLLGQIVNYYGRNQIPIRNGKSPFVQLLESIHPIDGLHRIRFTSPHPSGFRSDLIETMSSLPKICEHVHLPLQSGSDRILKVMRRSYNVNQYRRIIDQLRSKIPHIAITTDIIVGFPSETESEFEQTLRLTKEIQFDQAFIFRYSPRKDTPAAVLTDQLQNSEKQRRNQILLQAINEVALSKLEADVGTTQEILVEGVSKKNPKRLTGRTRQNRIVVFEGTDTHLGKLLNVHIEKCLGFSLLGKPTH